MEAKNMNMRVNDPKKNKKGSVLGGVIAGAIGTVVGAAAGTAGATVAYNHFRSDDDEDIAVVDNDVEVAQAEQPAEQQEAAAPAAKHATAHATAHVAPATAHAEIVTSEPENEVEVEPQPEPVPASDATPDVRVLSFQTITTDDGTQMDVAEVLVDGQDALIVDADRDGWADGLIADANADGNISDDEIVSFAGTDVQIPMQELAQAVEQAEEEPEPTYTSNDEADVIVADAALTVTPETDDEFIEAHDGGEAMPDYINDANVSDIASDAMYASNDVPADNTDIDMGSMV